VIVCILRNGIAGFIASRLESWLTAISHKSSYVT